MSAKILEVVYDPEFDELDRPCVLSFQEYVRKTGRWHRKKERGWPRRPNRIDSVSLTSMHEAPAYDNPAPAFAPNLSLNVGIKKLHPAVFWAVAVCGFFLQAGVLVYACVATYYLHWGRNGKDEESYSYVCPLVLIGTVLVGTGVYLCAYLIGQSTDEEVWCKGARQDDRASIHWLQPGGQRVGDQTFHAFSYSDKDNPKDILQEYTISWRNEQSPKAHYTVWVAVSITISGFILQFIGLRGVHSAVAVAQLGAVMAMAIARAGLRMQRLTPDANALASHGEMIIGHELDWLALRLGREDIKRYITRTPSLPQDFSGPETAFHARWIFHSAPCTPVALTGAGRFASNKPNIGRQLLSLRARLASLTIPPSVDARFSVSPSAFDANMVEGRRRAKYLVAAIVAVANTVFSNSTMVRMYWRTESTMCWKFGCKVSLVESDLILDPDTPGTYPSRLSRVLGAPDSSWQASESLHEEMEAALGLWLWGLKCQLDDLVIHDGQDASHDWRRLERLQACTIVTAAEDHGGISLRLWHSRSTLLEHSSRYEGHHHHTNSSTLWRLDEERDAHVPAKIQSDDNSELERDDALNRVFGWYALHRQPCPAGQPLKLVASTVKSSRPLAFQCEQEIFGTFVMAILATIHDLGPITLEEIDGSFQLSNNLVASLVQIFVENNLGSEEDALLCILPAILARLKASSLQCAIEAAKQTANTHRREQRWSKARDVLQWMFNEIGRIPPSELNGDSRDSMIEELVGALGELYRHALRAPGHYQFGIDGINQHLAELDRFPPAVPIISRYLEVARRFHTEPGRGSPGFLLSALRSNDLTTTLIGLAHLQPPDDGDTVGDALSLAARLGWSEVVLSLLELESRPDDSTIPNTRYLYNAPLVDAIKSGDVHTVNNLLTRCNEDILAPFKKKQAILDAAKMGHVLVAERLLGITHTALDASPLISAVEQGYTRLSEVLIANGADVNARNACGRTPLYIAVERDNVPMVRTLLDNGADTELAEETGTPPLVMAVVWKHLKIVRLLVQNDANVNARHQYLRTPLHWAAAEGHGVIANLLLANGANTETVDVEDQTPLMYAKRYGHVNIVDKLEWHKKKTAYVGTGSINPSSTSAAA
ncbi:ankyrin repeat domain-containing protein [Aspergillus mulundensis]|uniref:Uncharacterized protein n=1 Tax=Aspergillus mulundensis TaxID=1810919 RepID=A0A3D8T4Z5_9EURO|nr:hypothetical protein DSM5745_00948 [Aspergillus mulundensis]RDW93626.1 hypothetical protein DSM5745_00948 [Aspergillus mulundensis]